MRHTDNRTKHSNTVSFISGRIIQVDKDNTHSLDSTYSQGRNKRGG